MDHLDLVLWLVLYPIADSITTYIGSEARRKLNLKNYTENTLLFNSWVNLIVYVFVAIKLY